MATVHFYLVRHGQTKLNRYKRLQGVTNSPLTKRGIRMARRLGKELKNVKFEAVYTSDLKRTRETAQYILNENERYFPSVYQEPGLREISFGRFEEAKNIKMISTALRALGVRRIVQALMNDEHVAELTELFRFMDSDEIIEDSTHLAQRMMRTLSGIAKEYEEKGGNILIVTHGLILSNFIESLRGDVPLFLLDNSRASRVDYIDGQFKVIYVNKLKMDKKDG
ncbi:histidine phosphatase family protein [Ligilactobacillus sp. WILCCON 0076]|uniref:Histidine phosphatase family protein n=1 Tax=Ligilactobacillus ubinensis TaxID=2876789 RepID=A0A9X2FGR8_9LACO|nr:histidine phosphatase family protein [Ligilactobacillus ubinensis]MCP0885971.1 histidine phosphatase family protein [Ligilactobacillus ubinensis]